MFSWGEDSGVEGRGKKNAWHFHRKSTRKLLLRVPGRVGTGRGAETLWFWVECGGYSIGRRWGRRFRALRLISVQVRGHSQIKKSVP